MCIRDRLRSGIKVTVNTDNMTVSNTTIAKEFELLKKCGMTEDEKAQLLRNSVEAAFLQEEKKALLMEKVLKREKEVEKYKKLL